MEFGVEFLKVVVAGVLLAVFPLGLCALLFVHIQRMDEEESQEQPPLGWKEEKAAQSKDRQL